MPKRSAWTTEEGIGVEVWDLPAPLRRAAAASLGPMDRLVRVRAKGLRAPESASERHACLSEIPYPRGAEPFTETWLIVARETEPLHVLHVLSGYRHGEKRSVVTEHGLPRDLIAPIAAARGLSYPGLRALLMSDVVAGVEILHERVRVDRPDTSPEGDGPERWWEFTLHEGGEGLRQILHILPVAHPLLSAGVRWIPGPVSGACGLVWHDDPEPFRQTEEKACWLTRLVGVVPWRQGERIVVVELPAVIVSSACDMAELLESTWWSLLKRNNDVSEHLHAMWLVDAHTRTGDALKAAVPGVRLANCSGNPNLARTGLIHQLAWSWLLKPDLSPRGGGL